MTRDATRGGQKSAQLSEADDFEAIMTAWAAQLRTRAAMAECFGCDHVDAGRVSLAQALRLAATLDQLAALHDAPERAQAAEASLRVARHRYELREALVFAWAGYAFMLTLAVEALRRALEIWP